MTEVCPECGQRLRAGWARCPRCRYWLEGARATTAGAGASNRPVWFWALAVAALVAVAVATLSLLDSSSDAPQEVSASNVGSDTPAEATSPVTPRNQPREVDPGLRAEHDKTNALRAGGASYTLGNLPAALAHFEAAVAAKPDDPDARNNLAQVLVRQNRVADALPHLDEAVRLEGTRWAFRFNRARVYGLLNRWPEALTEYQVASQLFPEDYATHYNIGLVLMRLKRYPESVQALERAVALAPGEPQFLITLGTAYVGASRPDRARAVFQQFLEAAPEDDEVPRVKALLAAMTAAGQ